MCYINKTWFDLIWYSLWFRTVILHLFLVSNDLSYLLNVFVCVDKQTNRWTGSQFEMQTMIRWPLVVSLHNMSSSPSCLHRVTLLHVRLTLSELSLRPRQRSSNTPSGFRGQRSRAFEADVTWGSAWPDREVEEKSLWRAPLTDGSLRLSGGNGIETLNFIYS